MEAVFRIARRAAAAARPTRLAAMAAKVQYEYPTKVFHRDLVKFADTEEYIYK